MEFASTVRKRTNDSGVPAGQLGVFFVEHQRFEGELTLMQNDHCNR